MANPKKATHAVDPSSAERVRARKTCGTVADASQLLVARYGETQPVTDIFFTPGNPRSARATAIYF